MIIGMDIGTTHCKAGVYDEQGRLLRIARRPLPAAFHPWGMYAYDPEAMWQTASELLAEVSRGLAAPVGVAGMAETGLLVDRRSLQPRTPLFAWYDPIAAPQAAALRASPDDGGRFSRRGVRISFKFAAAKCLWLKEHHPALLEGAVWLSAPGYMVLRLTGQAATDASLAVRTYAFDLPGGEWDTDWLARLGLPVDLFPGIIPNGQVCGLTPQGAPVYLAGHDHVCGLAALGLPFAIDAPTGQNVIGAPGGLSQTGATSAASTAGAHGGRFTPEARFMSGLAPSAAPSEPVAAKTSPLKTASTSLAGVAVLDSLGTAESMLGAFPMRPLTAADEASGFSFGRHVLPGQMVWMGGLSTSGGALDWLRGVLSQPALSFNDVTAMLADLPAEPTGIAFYPYLSGRGAPYTNPKARAGFYGLTDQHGRPHLLRALLEGVCFEMESIRRWAVDYLEIPIHHLVAAGGPTTIAAWMQLKADISGCTVAAAAQPDLTLLGAALQTLPLAARPLPGVAAAYTPNPSTQARYRAFYEEVWEARLNDHLPPVGREPVEHDPSDPAVY